MIVMSVQEYMLCGDILHEIVEADKEFGADGAEVECLYEVYLDQLRACGIPFEETETNIYDVPAQFRAWVEELRNA